MSAFHGHSHARKSSEVSNEANPVPRRREWKVRLRLGGYLLARFRIFCEPLQTQRASAAAKERDWEGREQLCIHSRDSLRGCSEVRRFLACRCCGRVRGLPSRSHRFSLLCPWLRSSPGPWKALLCRPLRRRYRQSLLVGFRRA